MIFKACHTSNFKAGRTSSIKYIVIHYTANNGDTAKNNAVYYANNKVGASAHYFVDEKEIYQSVKDTDKGWYFKEQTVNNAVVLTKTLMAKYNIPVENVIRHYDVWGKICPAPFVNNESKWKAFKERLQVNKYSYDKTVDNMIKDGITTVENMAYWEKVLDGREPLNKEYVRAVLDRYSGKLG